MALSLAVAGPGPAAAEPLPVDLELVLAVDVSGSIDAFEARQQREGYLSAIVNPAVVSAIEFGELGRIAVTYVEWAGAPFQTTVVDWTLIDGKESARAFADALAARPVNAFMWTSISHAIDYAATLFEGNGFEGTRRVIDVSGDGPNNRGRSVLAARDDAVAAGITINGVPILNDRPQPFGLPTPMELNLDRYYESSVIGGPNAFMVIAQDFQAFGSAILSKLIKEIAGYSSGDTARRNGERDQPHIKNKL